MDANRTIENKFRRTVAEQTDQQLIDDQCKWQGQVQLPKKSGSTEDSAISISVTKKSNPSPSYRFDHPVRQPSTSGIHERPSLHQGTGSVRSFPAVCSPTHSRPCSPVPVSSYTSGIPHTCSSLNSTISETTTVCRICHGDGRREQLLSPCYCAGSIGMLHLSCLQRWLGSSNKTHCELCNFQFTMERRPKPFRMFLKNPGSDKDKRHLICDFVCFSILTPLTIAAVWFCLHGALSYNTKKLESIGLSTLGAALFILYIIWLTICTKHNINLWRDWQQFNQDVKLKCHPPPEGPKLVPIAENGECSTMPSRGARRGTVKLCSIEIKVTTGGDTSPRVRVSDKRSKADVKPKTPVSRSDSRRQSLAESTASTSRRTAAEAPARYHRAGSKETYV